MISIASAYSMPVREWEPRAEQCEEKQHLRLWKSTALIVESNENEKGMEGQERPHTFFSEQQQYE